MKSVMPTKEDLRLYIEGLMEDGLDEVEYLCEYCTRYNGDCKPEDCQPDANNKDCFDAYTDMVKDAIYEARTAYI